MKNHRYINSNKNLLLIFILSLILGCNSRNAQFDLITAKKTGIDFINRVQDTKDASILDYLNFYNGGGISIGDVNNDSLPDLFLIANMGKNALFLNTGNMQFKEVTEQAGVGGNSDWNTGSAMADVNGDGWLDIYVMAVVGICGFEGHNELYINQGDGTFKEESRKYGLDFDTYSSTAAFFDYDKDGDLDMYLLNQAVHTSKSYGPATLRYQKKYESGDRLMRYDNGKFTDVSEEAGILSGIIGYGLGIGVADFNNDGWDDMYISNDFFENDYYYLNNGDGTFSEKLTEYFGMTSRFSMGNDIGDINGDGYMDIISLDMLPDDEKILKASSGDNSMAIEMRKEMLGYHPQYSRNMLQLNNKGKSFSEIALLSGVAATDWSWAPLFADFNQDGIIDLFIGAGIQRRPNDLDYIKFISNKQIQSTLENTNLVDNLALKAMPTGIVHNYIFQGEGYKFIDQSGKWIPIDTLKSNGIAYGDLDNDGDLDLVTNNFNAKPVIYRNKNSENLNYLKLKFNYREDNLFGIGSKVFLYENGKMQTRQLFCTRGYQATVEPIVHFGLNNTTSVDSILIVWPDNTFQKLENVDANQTLYISPGKNLSEFNWNRMKPIQDFWFEAPDSSKIILAKHTENNYIDFDRKKLIPYKISAEGPAFCTADVNGDNKTDVFLGASKRDTARLFIQTENGFVEKEIPDFASDAIFEDVDAQFADIDNDGDIDLFVVSAGGEFYGTMPELKDRVYINNGEGDFSKNPDAIPDYFENGSVARFSDFDGDGDQDVFVGGRAVSYRFGDIPKSYILENNGKGVFTISNQPEILQAGMITDAVWYDFNNDRQPDLIAVGEWMKPQFFQNESGTFKNVTENYLSEKLNGLWRAISVDDIDNDGDIDLLLGNWGMNSKFHASNNFPLKMYFNDFDGNGQTESLVAMANKRKYYPINNKDELDSQLGEITGRYLNYHDFAGKTMEEIFGKQLLYNSKLLEVNTLESGYLRNDKEGFKFVPFAKELQISPINRFLVYDFNRDGKNDILTGANFLGVPPYHGRFISNSGIIISGDGTIKEGFSSGLNYSQKEIRNLKLVDVGEDKYLVAVPNNCFLIWNKLLK